MGATSQPQMFLKLIGSGGGMVIGNFGSQMPWSHCPFFVNEKFELLE